MSGSAPISSGVIQRRSTIEFDLRGRESGRVDCSILNLSYEEPFSEVEGRAQFPRKYMPSRPDPRTHFGQVYAHFLGGIDGLPPLPEEFWPQPNLVETDPPPLRENEADRKLRLAFGEDEKGEVYLLSETATGKGIHWLVRGKEKGKE